MAIRTYPEEIIGGARQLAAVGPSWPSGIVFLATLVSCVGDPTSTGPSPSAPNPDVAPNLSCHPTQDDFFNGGPGPDGIPALVNPRFVAPDHPEAQYLEQYAVKAAEDPESPATRVVGLEVDGISIALPHNIFWWHEIVNVDIEGRRLSVTYCPLTGSALVFDATAAGTNRFGVSGLIFQNNLVMFDEETESLWSQMCARAVAGDRAGARLRQIPAVEMLWETWRKRHPNTLVLSDETGFDFPYRFYPYTTYEDSEFLLFPLPRAFDDRLRMKGRVLGIPTPDGGIAFPFEELSGPSRLAAVTATVGTEDVLVLWDGAAEAAVAFSPRTTSGIPVELRIDGDRFVDRETGSAWDVEGRALSGPRAGERLALRPDAYVAFWFAWDSFNPNSRLWTAE